MANEHKTQIRENNFLLFSNKFDGEIMISTNGDSFEHHHPASDLESHFSTYVTACHTCRYDGCDMW